MTVRQSVGQIYNSILRQSVSHIIKNSHVRNQVWVTYTTLRQRVSQKCIYIYIYMYMCICICIYIYESHIQF